jgi:serine/threonine protein kinase
VVPFLICEHIPLSFSDVAQVHRDNWQERGLLQDTLRVLLLQPVSQGLFWSQNSDRIMVIFRDLKPDNLRFRDDGTMAVVDLGSSATFSVAGKNSGSRRMVSIVERQPTPVDPCDKRRGSGLLQGQSRLDCKYVGIPFSAIENFCTRVGDRGLAVIGANTPAFRDKQLKDQAASGRLRNKHLQQRFDANIGCWQDSFAFFRTVFHTLTRKPGQSINDWSAQAEKAAEQGVDGIKNMLLDAARGGPQQPLAFERLADYLYRGLCPRINTCENGRKTENVTTQKACENGRKTERMGIMGAVTHVFTTLAILTPDQERQFSSPTGLPFPHGAAVHKSWPTGFLESMSAADRAKVEKAIIPQLSYAKQPEMGGGLVSLEDVPGNSLLGVYVGRRVRNNICGTPYDAREFPSRFNVTGQGNLKIFKQLSPETKFTCDAQLDSKHDMKWCQLVGNSGPFINAAASQKLANCVVDRSSAWYDKDTGLIWMLVWSKDAGIKKGGYCMWYYKYKAGAGKLWNFDD